MTWTEVEEQVRQGAKLVLTNEIPGGWYLAIQPPPGASSDRRVIVPVQRLPDWAGEPRPGDCRSFIAALEMLLAEPESLN